MTHNDHIYLLGIRHHGPGSAASVRRALETIAPDIVLLEGAPEAESLLEYVKNPAMRPPVAQLIYAVDDHRDSVFYPFAEYSPEWQAMGYALENQLPLRFFDLPQSHSLALAREERNATQNAAETLEAETPETDAATLSNQGPADPDTESVDSLELSRDPLDGLARAAGFEDGERWWEQMVEQYRHDVDVFAAIGEAMRAAREAIEARHGISRRERLREAWMRKSLRQARREGYARIAVVCGAWHVPALNRNVAIGEDNALLKGLPKLKLQATWVPWSYGRISYRSGYGAGVEAPGWYHHLWLHNRALQRGDQNSTSLTVSWLTLAARTLRDQGYDVAPASVIDAVRLAETTAALRERVQPSLEEMNEAIQTLYCFGDATPMVLLKQRLLVGERLGQVPAELPKAPLQEDFARQLKALRLKTEAVEKNLELDLRKQSGAARSALFHRLNMLGIAWAKSVESRAGKGTFREVWQLQWQPDYELTLIEKSIWGNTLAAAAARYALQEIEQSDQLSTIIQWVDKLLLADLPDAIASAIGHLQRHAALATDLEQLMAALPGLATIVRYGDVRGTDSTALHHVVDGFVVRITVGLVHHCRQLDEDAARNAARHIGQVSEALKVLNNKNWLAEWWRAVQRLADVEAVHGIIAGRSYRLLLSAGAVTPERTAGAFAFALSRAEDPLRAAAWIEGLLEGSGLLLVHDERLWSVLDLYLCQISAERFQELLPLLRRTFASFSIRERENLLGKAAQAPSHLRRGQSENSELQLLAGAVSEYEYFDTAAAGQSLPLLMKLLGLPAAAGEGEA